jgi:alpha-tubulin suppressor-like RCC1 family protein
MRFRLAVGLCVLLGIVVAIASPGDGAAEQASQPTSPAAAQLDAGKNHTCALLRDGNVRCWGYGGDGELGYGNKDSVGDDDTPGSVAPVDLGPGRTAKAISAGSAHTCAVLDDGSVRCWGFGANGRLGYGNERTVGDHQTPGSVGPVDLGPGRTAQAISAGGFHTCALLDDGSVRCWGYGGDGQLGNASQFPIGQYDTPGSVPPVNLGPGRTAKAISAGGRHTCAILDDDSVHCWGYASAGQLGYGDTSNVGAQPTPTPGSVGPVNLGPGRTAKAISAGGSHTCAILDDGNVRCWGAGASGQLGYGNTRNVGDTGIPGLAGPVDLGSGRTAKAISAGETHTCALLDDRSVRCWGNGASGQLGYGNTNNVGDRATPGSAGPVDLGPGRTATAISAGGNHTCALLDTGSVRCWGYGGNGRLGYCDENTVGAHETPASAGPVNLAPGDGGVTCVARATTGTASGTGAAQGTDDPIRARGLHRCLAAVRSQARRNRTLLRHSTAGQRAQANRRLTIAHERCLHRFGRTPGHIKGLRAIARGKTQIELDFTAPGTDGTHPPPARSYQVQQSIRPIRNEQDFTRAQTLCKGACRFAVTKVGGKIALTITDLHPHTTYYYAITARDNISGQPGPRSHTVKAKTR